jgi:hypothetical protein
MACSVREKAPGMIPGLFLSDLSLANRGEPIGTFSLFVLFGLDALGLDMGRQGSKTVCRAGGRSVWKGARGMGGAEGTGVLHCAQDDSQKQNNKTTKQQNNNNGKDNDNGLPAFSLSLLPSVAIPKP